MNKRTKNNGITLISLVITIIVMLILVGVSITLAVNGGLFEYAGNAVGDTKNAIENEQGLIDDIIDKYIIPNVPIEEKFSEIYNENTIITQGEYTATIPAGFAVGTSDGINKIKNGLVITDKVDENGNSIGNEFVWIPVKVTENDKATSIASFYRSAWEENARTNTLTSTSFPNSDKTWSDFTEPFENGYENETEDYNEMMESVYKNKGFYIGRYEAGIKTTESPRVWRGMDFETTENWVVQRDCYPYNFVAWGALMTSYEGSVTNINGKKLGLGALELCKNFYTEDDNVGAKSTLCYGIQWDAMLDFIKDDKHDVTDSDVWGNVYYNTGDTWKITRTTARYSKDDGKTWYIIGDEENGQKEKTNAEGILLTTGANDNFKTKNIYDITGNLWEWTNEVFQDNKRIIRGGDFESSKTRGNGAYRYTLSYNLGQVNVGFRPVLYVVNSD